MARKRASWLVKGLAAAVSAVAAVGLTATASQAQTDPTTGDVGIMASHKSPFNCGKTFYANNWYPGHNPSGSIDWQSYGGDAIGGETVRATAGGTARFYSTLAMGDEVGIMAYGNYVVVTHGDGTRTRYAHLATMVRGPGSSMSVGQGTAIGTVGGTGGNYAPHLHYEQITSGGSIDTSPTVEGVTVSLGQKKAIKSTNACSSGGNPYTPGEVCGSGYSTIDRAGLTGGTVYLMYNSGNGYNCVVTLKSTNLGRATSVSAFLEPQGGTRTTDSGSYGYYAGPVRKYAPGTCVRWGGSVGSSSYTSPFEHCG
ncbi:M23 family metallopeptidase [Actinophytocola sp. NPDC049390]|uniref:M23 family metallopeptidase n=1 Tax=Actinophytocola sp. NPDC049390 TaxID=3363894 RepID=UPI0037AF6E35